MHVYLHLTILICFYYCCLYIVAASASDFSAVCTYICMCMVVVVLKSLRLLGSTNATVAKQGIRAITALAGSSNRR